MPAISKPLAAKLEALIDSLTNENYHNEASLVEDLWHSVEKAQPMLLSADEIAQMILDQSWQG